MKNLPLKSLILSIVGVLALMLVGNAGLGAYDAWQNRKTALEQSAATRVSDLALASIEQQVLERALTNRIFLGGGDTAALRGRLTDIRQKGDTVFANAVKNIGDFAAREGGGVNPAEAETLYGAFVAARKGLDLAIDTNNADVRLEALGKFQKAATLLSDRLETMRLSFAQNFGSKDPVFARLSNLKHLDWVILENGIRKLQAIGGYIVEDAPIPPDGLASVSNYGGRIEVAWKSLAGAIGEDDTSLYAAVTELKQGYFGPFKEIRDAAFEAGVNAESYSIKGKAWFDKSGDALGSVLASMRRIVAVSEEHGAKAVGGAENSVLVMTILLLAGVTLTVVSFWVVLSGLIRPMANMTGYMTALADGERDVQIRYINQKNEIGAMAKAVEVFKRNLLENERLQREQREAEKTQREEERRRDEEQRAADHKADAARREAEENAQAKQRAEMLELADSFEKSVGGIIEIVSASVNQMQSTANAMTEAARDASKESAAVASASEAATGNVQSVASATEELSESIHEIFRQVSESANSANGAVNDVEQTNVKVQGLSEAAQKIGDVVELINDIASQTNLLALNATIEAARAGEAGKGFAVVATEVKSLADQTARATEEIGGQIGAIQAATRDAVEAMEGIGGTINDISEVSSSIAESVEQQREATREIAESIQQAASGTRDVAGNIESVSSAVGETGQAAAQVLAAADELNKQSEDLRGSVGSFLERVRAS